MFDDPRELRDLFRAWSGRRASPICWEPTCRAHLPVQRLGRDRGSVRHFDPIVEPRSAHHRGQATGKDMEPPRPVRIDPEPLCSFTFLDIGARQGLATACRLQRASHGQHADASDERPGGDQRDTEQIPKSRARVPRRIYRRMRRSHTGCDDRVSSTEAELLASPR